MPMPGPALPPRYTPPSGQRPMPTPPNPPNIIGLPESEKAKRYMDYYQKQAEYQRAVHVPQVVEYDPVTGMPYSEEMIERQRAGVSQNAQLIYQQQLENMRRLEQKKRQYEQAEALAERTRQQESAERARAKYIMQDVAADARRMREDRTRLRSPEYFAKTEADYLRESGYPAVQQTSLPDYQRQQIMQSFASRGMYGTDAMNEALARAEAPYQQAAMERRRREQDIRNMESAFRMAEQRKREQELYDMQNAYTRYQQQFARPSWELSPESYVERAYQELFGGGGYS